jgi:hypothetical protein
MRRILIRWLTVRVVMMALRLATSPLGQPELHRGHGAPAAASVQVIADVSRSSRAAR